MRKACVRKNGDTQSAIKQEQEQELIVQNGAGPDPQATPTLTTSFMANLDRLLAEAQKPAEPEAETASELLSISR